MSEEELWAKYRKEMEEKNKPYWEMLVEVDTKTSVTGDYWHDKLALLHRKSIRAMIEEPSYEGFMDWKLNLNKKL